MTKKTDDYLGYQEHPRYGRKPRITGLNPSGENVFLHWHSGEGVRIPNTAIGAHTAKQPPATFQVTHYFDSKRICRKCGAYFIFFAEEQRYWYEALKFPLEANAVECTNCRKHEQKLGEAREIYEALLAKQERSEEETIRMVESGLFLVEEGLFSHKVLSKFRGFLKALEIIPVDRVRALQHRIVAVEQRAP